MREHRNCLIFISVCFFLLFLMLQSSCSSLTRIDSLTQAVSGDVAVESYLTYNVNLYKQPQLAIQLAGKAVFHCQFFTLGIWKFAHRLIHVCWKLVDDLIIAQIHRLALDISGLNLCVPFLVQFSKKNCLQGENQSLNPISTRYKAFLSNFVLCTKVTMSSLSYDVTIPMIVSLPFNSRKSEMP